MSHHKPLVSLTFVCLLSFATQALAQSEPKPLDVKSFRDKLEMAYFTANREDKFLLMFFSSGDSRECMKMRDNLVEKDLAIFSNQWIVCDTDPAHDLFGKQFAELYSVDTFPSLILLKTTVNPESGRVAKTEIIGRMKQAYSGHDIKLYFENALHVYQNRGKVLDITAYHDRVFPAWEETKRNRKYALIFLNSDFNGFANRTLTALLDPRFAIFNDTLIVADTDSDYDPDAEFFIGKFDVRKLPTMLLLKPQMDPQTGQVKKVDLVGRMTGEQTADGMEEYFNTAITNYERALTEESAAAGKSEESQPAIELTEEESKLVDELKESASAALENGDIIKWSRDMDAISNLLRNRSSEADRKEDASSQDEVSQESKSAFDLTRFLIPVDNSRK